jgi:hypothetical protein
MRRAWVQAMLHVQSDALLPPIDSGILPVSFSIETRFLWCSSWFFDKIILTKCSPKVKISTMFNEVDKKWKVWKWSDFLFYPMQCYVMLCYVMFFFFFFLLPIFVMWIWWSSTRGISQKFGYRQERKDTKL